MFREDEANAVKNLTVGKDTVQNKQCSCLEQSVCGGDGVAVCCP